MRTLPDIACVLAILLGLEVRDSFASASDCKKHGEYVLHPTDRCMYIQCFHQYLPYTWWGRNRHVVMGFSKHCPEGRAAPRQRYPPSYRYRDPHQICTEWVGPKPHSRTGICDVQPNQTPRMYSPLHRTSATEKLHRHEPSNAVQNSRRQKPGRESFKKAYDNGRGYQREEMTYDIDAIALESAGQTDNYGYREENLNYQEQQDDESRAYYGNDLGYGEDDDFYVMEQEAGDAMLRSVSTLDASEDAEILSPEESRRMSAKIMAIGYGKM